MELWIICALIFAIIFFLYLILKIMYNVNYNTVLKNNIQPYNVALKDKLIPRKIFQLTADKNNINDAFKKNINYIKKMNPGWKYTLYDDDDIVEYIKKYFHPYVLDTYNRINYKYGAARSDFFRYLLMYQEGGVYLDLKSGSIIPFDFIIKPNDEYLLAHWSTVPSKGSLVNALGEFQQWHIICRPKHPFLAEVIKNVIKNIHEYDLQLHGVGKPGVLEVTGPIAYTKAIIPLLGKNKYRLFETNYDIGLKYNNIDQDHVPLFKNTHYSKVREPIVLNKEKCLCLP